MFVLNHSAAKQFDYRWHPSQRINKQQVPKQLWPWLTTHSSLTAKLQSVGELTVQVIEDDWGPATPRERKRLKLRSRQATRIRTVVLICNDLPVIYARSVVPVSALCGHWRQVKHLKNTPLGGYLFRHRGLKRSAVEIANLPKSLFPGQEQSLWARRSVFQQYGQGILVCEVFFQEITQLPQPFKTL
ncbi:chorismate--pyruvate lyase family protein [Marinomonas epiphytica]